ncbi:hypothetical protein [Stratiformator vulcanicus]|uniref:SLBB domain protein n=1 Tax=Stratiformator vulcanicus TaxID=2527980 RepID=A0A517QXE0_9PLAN|nr:hypothetical protein [Stratiformator vulcanicus]QDT36311.1 hypothetical protein Pan189_06670 [Stratiformator vulcanicus]
MKTLRSDRITTFGAAGIVCAGLCIAMPIRTEAAGPRAQTATRHQVQSFQNGATSATYIGVIGQIARPGSYHFDSASPTIGEVLKVAGPLTDEATGSVRIIRHGRTGIQMSVRPGSDYRLVPGDVLVIDGTRGRRFGVTGVTQTAYRAERKFAKTNDAARPAVQLAVVGIAERPVILKVAGERATPRAMVASLGQTHLDPARDIHVIAAGMNGKAISDRPLPEGSVLVFDPRRVRAETIPTLPEPIAVDASAIALTDGQAIPPAPTTAAPALPPLPTGPAITPEPAFDGPGEISSIDDGPLMSDLTSIPKLEMLPPPPTDNPLQVADSTGSHLSFIDPPGGAASNSISGTGVENVPPPTEGLTTDSGEIKLVEEGEATEQVAEAGTVSTILILLTSLPAAFGLGTLVFFGIRQFLAFRSDFRAFPLHRDWVATILRRSRSAVAISEERATAPANQIAVAAAPIIAAVPEPEESLPETTSHQEDDANVVIAEEASLAVETEVTTTESEETEFDSAPIPVQESIAIEEPISSETTEEVADDPFMTAIALMCHAESIEEEPVLWPSELHIHGRSTGLARLRVDAAENVLDAPHFLRTGDGRQQQREAAETAAAVSPSYRVDAAAEVAASNSAEDSLTRALARQYSKTPSE